MRDQGQHPSPAQADIRYSALPDSGCLALPCYLPPEEGDHSGLQEGGSRRKQDIAACSESHSFLGERDFLGNPGQRWLKDVNFFFFAFLQIFFFPLPNVPENWGGRGREEHQYFFLKFSALVFKSTMSRELFLPDGNRLSLSLHFPNPLPLHSHWEAASGALLWAWAARKVALRHQRPVQVCMSWMSREFCVAGAMLGTWATLLGVSRPHST